MSKVQIGTVFESTPNSIVVNVDSHEIFDANKSNMQVGRYLQIQEGNTTFVISQIQNIKSVLLQDKIVFQVSTRPIGMIDSNGVFTRGSIILPVPTEPVYLLSDDGIAKIYTSDEKSNYLVGKLLHNKDISYYLDGNKFFSKHVAVVGSTGSGKSCAVTRLLHNAVGIDNGGNKNAGSQKNSHIIIFDIHSEYANAFRLEEKENFSLNLLNVDNMSLPYWLMNADELESLFIESQEQNSHNQISIFKQAVTKNKELHNAGLNVTYDTPVYFSIKEVLNYITNMNNEMLYKVAGDEHYNCPRLSDGSFTSRESYFKKAYSFAEQASGTKEKTSGGPFKGDFDRFILRLETRLNDTRLDFLLHPLKANGKEYTTDDFSDIVKQFIGYIEKANVSIIDLSGIPFEVLSIVISLVSRIIFDFSFHYSKLKHSDDKMNDIPVLLVCEEAHNYIPKTGGAAYYASKRSLERIAKEGRKYGLSMMIVSQRPAEVSETIFAQCNNFIALRLNNDNDQNYIRRLLPENDSSVADILPNLGLGEALIVGDAALLPSLVKLDKPNPEPKSETVPVYTEWLSEWKEPNFEQVIERWRKS